MDDLEKIEILVEGENALELPKLPAF